MREATQAGHHDDWPSFVPKLREFGPATFRVEDYDRIGFFGVGPILDGDLQGSHLSLSSE